jgi:hypothetical protein
MCFWRRLPGLWIFLIFPFPIQIPSLYHDRFLPHPYKFISHPKNLRFAVSNSGSVIDNHNQDVVRFEVLPRRDCEDNCLMWCHVVWWMCTDVSGGVLYGEEWYDGRCMIVRWNISGMMQNKWTCSKKTCHNRFYMGWPRFESGLGKRLATDHLSHMTATFWRVLLPPSSWQMMETGSSGKSVCVVLSDYTASHPSRQL